MQEITLDGIVRGYLLSQGRNTLHGYIKALKHCVDFLKKFSVQHSYTDKIVSLSMDYKKAVQFPEDLVVIKKIGWADGDRIVSFTPDQTVNLYHSHADDAIAGTPNTSYQVVQPYSNTDDIISNVLGNQQGLGHNKIGYYRINYPAREVQFSSDVSASRSIYIEYASNGFNPKTKSTIPEIYSTVAENYINWQLSRAKHGDSSGETEARRQAFWNDYDNIFASQNRISYEGLVGIKARAHDINKTI